MYSIWYFLKTFPFRKRSECVPNKSNDISNRHFMFENALYSIHYPTLSQRGIFISKMHYLPHRL